MYRITGDKDAVEQLLEDTATLFDKAGTSPAARTAGISADDQAGFQDIAGKLDEALDRLRNQTTRPSGPSAAGIGAPTPMQNRAPSTPYAPRDQYLALFQSAMDEYLAKVGATPASPGSSGGLAVAAATGPRSDGLDTFYQSRAAARPPASGPHAANVFEQFGTLDPRWAEVVVEHIKVLVNGKHKFLQPASPSDIEFPLDEMSTIAIVGDWGGGNEAAQAVARQIAQLKPSHVIHLGDVYYAGTPKEVQERFLRYWPKPDAPGHSFALNSNHEMYSGGYAYFDLTLQAFKQPTSYFTLSNRYWRFIGLDSGYDDHDLHPPQADWLRAQVAKQGPRNILLTHHQLFSAFETTDTSKLEAKVSAALPNVYGWIWGHEHLAVVYENYKGINAICLGNGCFPYVTPAAAVSKVPVRWLDRHKPQNPDADYPGGHTFALLTLDGPKITMDFISESGQKLYTQTWP